MTDDAKRASLFDTNYRGKKFYNICLQFSLFQPPTHCHRLASLPKAANLPEAANKNIGDGAVTSDPMTFVQNDAYSSS